MYWLRSSKRKISQISQVTTKRRRVSLNKQDVSSHIKKLHLNRDQNIVYATHIHNYLIDDPLQDWLKYHTSSLALKKPEYTQDIISSHNHSDPFVSYIMNQGIEFEKKILKLITNKFGIENVVSIGADLNPTSLEKLNHTYQKMNEGIPFIHSGLLHNPNNKTAGIPDFLVRSDWLSKLVTLCFLPKKEQKIGAPLLQPQPSYHYVVVDVKFSTLNLKCNGIHLTNCGHYKGYKGQLLIYNQALGLMQGYEPPEAYILGRKWKYNVKGNTYTGDSCFDRLGVIDYNEVDIKYIELTEKAIQWVRDVRSEEAREWNILSPPLTRKELYPNMCNTRDSKWRSIKKKIAKEYNELTMLWMVGKKHREFAHQSGVYSWKDKKCDVNTLNINGKFTRKVLDKILEINQPHRRRLNLKIKPSIIKNNMYGWQTPRTIEFFVDFETINNVFTDHSTLPYVPDSISIFMIGVGYIDPETDEWIYRSFVVDSLTMKEERKICHQFSDYIYQKSSFYQIDKPLCFHWGHAENSTWTGTFDRHNFEKDILYNSKYWNVNWEWCDLLKVFKEEPIVIQGCLNFSLKNVAKTMKKHKMIETEWESGSACTDGVGAMVGAWKSYKECEDRDVSVLEIPLMKDIEKYNEVDCKVLQEMISYLRINHSSLYQNFYLDE